MRGTYTAAEKGSGAPTPHWWKGLDARAWALERRRNRTRNGSAGWATRLEGRSAWRTVRSGSIGSTDVENGELLCMDSVERGRWQHARAAGRTRKAKRRATAHHG